MKQTEETMLLTEETAERILYLIRLCHPDEKGETYTRSEMITEVQRRGLQLLKDLGWNTSLGSIWKNRYTGSEEKFANLLHIIKDENEKARGESLYHQLPFIIEHWTPKELWTDEDLNGEYKSKLDRWVK